MAEFIVNPRRAPRAPVRCYAAVRCGEERFETETEDVGSMGCQVVSPRLVCQGSPVELVLTNEKIDEPLEATGHVAWVSAQAPWRVGIAFEDRCVARSARWFDRLVAAYPALAGYGRVPDRIRTDAIVYLGPPPRFVVDFTSEEAALLRAIASGARIDELMARLREDWPAALRALFSLIARHAVTFQRGRAVHPDSWKRILTEVEASLAVESLGQVRPGLRAPPAPSAAHPSAMPPPIASGPAPTPPPVHDPTRVVDLQDDGSSLELEQPTRGRRPGDR
jgi:PilZ domain